MEKTTTDTKTTIMDVAEKLFAEKGIDATSTRAIVTEASVNLAAINYHFGSKEGLLTAVMQRIVGKINDERLRQLDSLEAEKGKPELKEILHAFLSPVVKTMKEEPQRIKYFFRLFSQIHTDPEKFQRIGGELFMNVGMRFKTALQQAVPHLSEHEVMWRFKFMLGTMQMMMVQLPLPGKSAKEEIHPKDINQIIDYAVQFVAAGFNAPATQSNNFKQNKE